MSAGPADLSQVSAQAPPAGLGGPVPGLDGPIGGATGLLGGNPSQNTGAGQFVNPGGIYGNSLTPGDFQRGIRMTSDYRPPVGAQNFEDVMRNAMPGYFRELGRRRQLP